MDTTGYTTSQFAEELYRLKNRNCELRKQLVERMAEVHVDVSERAHLVATWEFEILDVEDGCLSDSFVTQHHFITYNDIDKLIPDANKTWECDYETLLRDTQRIERLCKPGVLEMVYLVESMGLYE
jgi:hypothetical protein